MGCASRPTCPSAPTPSTSRRCPTSRRSDAALRTMTERPRLAVSLGDVRGIGPEIVAAALADERVRAAAELRIVGPASAGIPVDESVGEWPADAERSESLAGRLAGAAVERAVDLAPSRAVDRRGPA